MVSTTFAAMNFRKAGLIIVGVILVALYFLNRNDVILEQQQFLQVRRISASGGEISSVIRLKNPNLLSSTIKIIHEKFYLNGILLGIIDNELNQGIPGLKVTEFPASIRFNSFDYQNALNRDSLNASHAVVMVEGEIQFQNLFISGKITIHQSAPINYRSQ